ncbi:hypothetical protein Lfu02_55160 [Longispora fulva]|uniref:Uncharacterized protein n=1 Tax=Longispora fulva TaxID=619741 RepID=A0A8J7GSK8_9ACTN|nr:hypothetical protein [Longispora fulva]GIG61144.1 hypothetical protein Lfu02_55160 [Longispora fulva]
MRFISLHEHARQWAEQDEIPAGFKAEDYADWYVREYADEVNGPYGHMVKHPDTYEEWTRSLR